MLTAFRKNAAYHEAGHAVAAWRLRLPCRALVLPNEQSGHVDNEKPLVACRGAVATLDTPYWILAKAPMMDSVRMALFDQGFRHIVAGRAGVHAEARYSGQDTAILVVPAALGCWNEARLTAKYMAGEKSAELLELADRCAGKLVRDRWSDVEAIAEKLSALGEVSVNDKVFAGIKWIDGDLLDVTWTPTGITWKETSAA